MAVNSISALQILFRMGGDLGETRGFRIASVTNSAYMSLALPTSTDANEYQWAFAQVFGKGLSQVTSHTSVGVATFSPAFGTLPTAGEVVGMAFWNPNKAQQALDALNAFIEASFPFWYREVRLDQNNLTLADGTATTLQTLAVDTDTYSLPSDCAILSRVGIQADADRAWNHEYAPMDLWRVEGNEGAKRIRFFNNGRVYIPGAHAGQGLCLHYMAREPKLNSLWSTSCQIPLEAFSKAAVYFKQRNLWRDGRTDLTTDNVALPQTQMEANAAWARVGAVKTPLAEGPFTGWRLA